MKTTDHRSHHERWAYLRFSVMGQLLAAPPPKGELRAELERACGTRVAASDHGGAGALWGIDVGALVPPSAKGAPRSGAGSTTKGARRCRHSRLIEPGDPRGAARPICRPPELEDRPALLESAGARRAAARARARAVLLEHPPVLQGAGLPQAPALERAAHGGRRARGGAAAAARGAQLRGRPRGNALALGCASRLAQSASRRARNGTSRCSSACIDDRSRLLCHLQWYRSENCGKRRPWPDAGVAEPGATALGLVR